MIGKKMRLRCRRRIDWSHTSVYDQCSLIRTRIEVAQNLFSPI